MPGRLLLGLGLALLLGGTAPGGIAPGGIVPGGFAPDEVLLVAAPRRAAPLPGSALVPGEVLALEPRSLRLHPITATQGRVLALERSPDGKRAALVLGGRARRAAGGKSALLAETAALEVELETGRSRGPAPIPGEPPFVRVLFAPDGTARWKIGFQRGLRMTEEGALAEVPIDESAPYAATGTLVSARELQHLAPPATGPARAEGPRISWEGRAIVIERPGAGRVRLEAPRLLEPASLALAPGGRYLAVAGRLFACGRGAPDRPSPRDNELFVADLLAPGGPPALRRIARGPSAFAARWLDAHTLVYETGFGRAARLALHDAATGATRPVPTEGPAGLHGVPTATCRGEEGEWREDDEANRRTLGSRRQRP